MSNFFDRAKHDMGKYLKAAEIKAAEVAENAKINLEIYSLKREKNEALLSLGRMVYRMFLKGQFDSAKIERECRTVVLIDEEIKKVKEKGRRAHHEARKAYRNAHHGKSRNEGNGRSGQSDKGTSEEDGGAEDE